MKNNFLLTSIAAILLTALLVAVPHQFLLSEKKMTDIFPLGLTYIFLILLGLISVSFVYWRYKTDATSAGNAFFITVFVKMSAAVVFIFPDGLVFSKPDAKAAMFHFLIPFAIFLFVETLLLVRLLKGHSAEKLKNDENQS